MPERRDEPLDDRLRAGLDRLPAPDLWREASAPGRPERPLPPTSSPGRRIAIAAFALLVFAGSVTFLLAGGGGGPTTTASTPPETISVSKRLEYPPGIRCTASMPSVVEPGAPLGLTATLRNVSDATVKVSLFPPSFPVEIVAGDGTTWNTQELMNHSWPLVLPTPLAPGETKTVDPTPIAVQFPGPLAVTATCAGEPMPVLHATVDDTGEGPSTGDAVALAAGAASGMLDGCTPPPGGSAVGTVAPPGGTTAPMPVRCSASVVTHPGFAVVTFAITTPPDATPPPIPAGLLSSVGLPSASGNAETVVWRFVAASGARPVASATHARSLPADAMDTSYDISSTGWSTGDTSRCGGEEYSAGGDGSSVTLVFFDACH